MGDAATWPDLPYAAWRDTAVTLQLWTQVVGKIRLTLTPWLNHGWQVPLYVTARGLGTSPIPTGNEILEIEFDFIDHRLLAGTSRGVTKTLPLEPRSVADFHRQVMRSSGRTRRRRRHQRNAERDREPDPLFARIAPTPPMTPPRHIASGARSCRRTASSSCSAAAFSARRAPSISSGAASTSP